MVDLLGHAAALDHSAPALVHRLAESQISDLSMFLKDLGRAREVVADGDEWFWTFTLTSNVRHSIDATSYSALGKDERSLWDDDGWNSELGRRYLELQAQAVQRGVVIRRIFILETPSLLAHPGLREICDRR